MVSPAVAGIVKSVVVDMKKSPVRSYARVPLTIVSQLLTGVERFPPMFQVMVVSGEFPLSMVTLLNTVTGVVLRAGLFVTMVDLLPVKIRSHLFPELINRITLGEPEGAVVLLLLLKTEPPIDMILFVEEFQTSIPAPGAT